MKDLFSLNSVQNFRMELDCIELLGLIACSCNRAVSCVCDYLKIWSNLADIVKVTHPHNGLVLYSLKKLVLAAINEGLGLAILPNRSLLNLTTKDVHHELSSIAKAKNGDSQFKELFCIRRCAFFIAGVRASC